MRDEELDRLIDAELSTYAEPRTGIEQRVLSAMAAVREDHGRAKENMHLKPHPLWRLSGTTNVVPFQSAGRVWALILSAAACVLIAILVGMRFARTPRAGSEQAINGNHAPAVNGAAAPEMRSTAPVRVETAHRVRRDHALRKQRLPKQDIFPTPQPLTPEMQALVQFAARAPEKERQALVQAKAQMDAPLKIAPLRIAALDSSSHNGD